MSMMVGQVFTSTAPAASLDLSSLIKVWVVRIQAALLTCRDEHSLKKRVPAAQELMFRESFIICSQFLSANLISFLCSASPSLNPQCSPACTDPVRTSRAGEKVSQQAPAFFPMVSPGYWVWEVTQLQDLDFPSNSEHQGEILGGKTMLVFSESTCTLSVRRGFSLVFYEGEHCPSAPSCASIPLTQHEVGQGCHPWSTRLEQLCSV